MAVRGRLGVTGWPSEKLIGACEWSVEGFDNLFSHFVAAGADRRPQRRQQLPGIGPEDAPHISHGFLDHARQRAAPARMNRRHHPPLGIHQQHRQAISDSDRQQDACFCGHQPVSRGRACCGLLSERSAGRLVTELARPVTSQHKGMRGMDLPQRREHKTRCANFSEEAPAIQLDELAPVPSAKPQVEAGARGTASTAPARAERVDEPRQLAEAQSLEPRQAAAGNDFERLTAQTRNIA